MLPSNLLRTRRHRDKITPVFAELTEHNFELAELLIRTYENHVGLVKSELENAIVDLEDLGYDYRYIRGLSILLERRCQFETTATINPVEIRRRVFIKAFEKGLPITSEKRLSILNETASKLNITVEELEKSLHADLEERFKLRHFKTLESVALIKQYNLSLTQTLLFYSTEVTFTASGNWQQIFRQIKWLGLIYTVWKESELMQVKVDGPVSIFKLNRRYGTSLAKLLPYVIRNKKWRLKAKILQKGERRLLELDLDNQRHARYIRTLENEEIERYDSKVEEDFTARFKAIETEWTITREPEPIAVGKYVMIPDFGFEKDGMKVYLEVAGFWTPEYLKEKVKKLGMVSGIDMLVLANRKLACRKLERIGEKLNVIYYDRKIPLKPILAHLKSRNEETVRAQSRHLKIENIIIVEPFVEVRDLAAKLGVLKDTLKKALEGKSFPGYLRLGNTFIKQKILKEIQDELKSHFEQRGLNLAEASRIIEKAGGKQHTQILEALGYKINWKGIDSTKTEILRKKGN